jgi:hypothetical protein
MKVCLSFVVFIGGTLMDFMAKNSFVPLCFTRYTFVTRRLYLAESSSSDDFDESEILDADLELLLVDLGLVVVFGSRMSFLLSEKMIYVLREGQILLLAK